MKNLKQKSFDITPYNKGEDVNKIRDNWDKIFGNSCEVKSEDKAVKIEEQSR